MGFGGGGAAGLFGGVVELEREDGEAVEDEAGRFGVERRGGVLLAGGVEQGAVDGLDEIVAGLVEGVDGALDGGDAGVGGSGLAGLVLLVPEVEVGAVMGEDECRGRLRAGAARWAGPGGVLVPAEGGFVVEAGDLEGVQHVRSGVRRDPSNCISRVWRDSRARLAGAWGTGGGFGVVRIYDRMSCCNCQFDLLWRGDVRWCADGESLASAERSAEVGA